MRDQLIVRGDAAKTAQNIIGAERLFRLSIAGDLITYILVIALIWALYILLRPVNKNLALLGVLFRLAENAILCVATINSLVVLRLLSGADYLKTFSVNQLNSLATLALGGSGARDERRIHTSWFGINRIRLLAAQVALRSQSIGGLGNLFVAGVRACYFGDHDLLCLAALGLTYMVPMGIYEIGLGFWLLFKGLKSGNDSEAECIDAGSGQIPFTAVTGLSLNL